MPQRGLELFATGLERFEEAIDEELDAVAAGRGRFKAVRGDYGAGKTFFAATCTACHMQDGMAAGGIGPKLAGLGIDAATIRHQVEVGGGPMPGGLASGKDLDNVVAYVLSIQ